MAWQGGFEGDGYSHLAFPDYLSKQRKPSWPKFIAIHATGAHYTLWSGGADKRMQNLGHYYKNQKRWSSGPHFFAMGTKVFPGTPVHAKGTHSPSWNGTALAIECEGDYRKTGKHSHLSGPGAINWDTMAWATAELLKWLGMEATHSTIRFHKEDTRTSHRECPGNIDKDWFIEKVKGYMGLSSTDKLGVKPIPANNPYEGVKKHQLFDVKEIQERLKAHGFDPGPIDGLMGPKTDSAIRAHQATLTISSTGLVGPWQMEKLRKAPKSTNTHSEPQNSPVAAVPGSFQETNPQKAMRLLQGAGYSKVQAAGIIGNLQRESYPSLKPEAAGDPINGVKTAFGIGQWRNERFDGLKAFAKARGKDWTDFESQVLYVPHELKTSEKLAAKWLNQAETVEQATAAMVWYERPRGYISARARAADSWPEVIAVSEKCDGYKQRLDFAKALA